MLLSFGKPLTTSAALLLVTLLLCFSNAMAAAIDPENANVRYGYDYDYGPPSQNIPCIMYEVRPGDYCYKIATKNGIPYNQFLSQNPGIDCTNLSVGQSVCLFPLSIPGWGFGGGSKSEPAVDCQIYTVKEGDLCSQIAKNFGISTRKLLELNKDMPLWNGCMNMFAGQSICVA
ncbi:hypothetical protein GGI07_005755 [Coemansia sp. Benny D115]|nr:hypothetical protein GGI07_005755 [Coemansia sp. Benny D115]